MPEPIGVVLFKSVILILALLAGFAYLTLFERKVVSRIQVRLGPNRVGPYGLLQPLADGLKLFFKEDVTPRGADVLIHALAPMISVTVALITFAVIPIGDSVSLLGTRIEGYLANVGIGILYIFAVTSLGVYGIVLAGWSSNNKYALLGGIRSSAQMISYELALGLSVVGVIMLTGSLSLVDIVNAQAAWPYVLVQPLGFLLFFTAAIAETNRAPFDLPEAEQELVAGYHTEYSGMKFAMFYMAEYVNMITASALTSTLFLGGWRGPILPGPVWLFLKIVILLFVYVWLRATLPRFRYDRLMRFGWMVMLPLALVNILLTALGIVVFG